jgi:hypothetical protein
VVHLRLPILLQPSDIVVAMSFAGRAQVEASVAEVGQRAEAAPALVDLGLWRVMLPRRLELVADSGTRQTEKRL